MKFHESIDYVRKVEGTTYALLEERQELFVMYHDNETEAFTNTMIQVAGERTGEGSYDPEEFYFEFEDVLDALDFIPCKRDVKDLLNNHFGFVLEEIDDYRIDNKAIS